MDALRNGKIDDRVALWIADFCPGNEAVQRRGLEAALRDASKVEVHGVLMLRSCLWHEILE